MTIRKGEPWGAPVDRPSNLLVCHSDREVAAAVASADSRPFTVAAGDLHRSVGAPAPRAQMQALPIDVLDVEIDGDVRVAVAHVVVRRSWWRGAVVAAFNVDHLGDWDVAPRAHPNDGRFDVVEVDAAMSIRQRWQARNRLPQGTHLPHPAITTRTGTEVSWSFRRPTPVWLDGERVASARAVAVRIRPDAATLFV